MRESGHRLVLTPDERRPCPDFFPSQASATARRDHRPGERATLRRDRPRRARRARGARPAQRGAPDPPRRLRRRRGGARAAGAPTACSRTDDAPRSPSTAWTSPTTTATRTHHRRPRRARARRRRQRRDAPRAHAAEGQDRPPRAAARDARQPRPDLGPVARARLSSRRRAAGDAEPDATAVDDEGVLHALVARSTTPSGSPRSRAASRSAGRARRRPPPVRDRDQLPPRSCEAGIDDPGADGDHGARRGARRRPALGRSRSTGCSPASPTPTCCGRGSAGTFVVRRRRPEHARGRRRARAARCATAAALGLVDRDGPRAARAHRRARTAAR